MAAAAADDLSDDELDAGVEAPIHMLPSSSWLSKHTWRNRSTDRMRQTTSGNTLKTMSATYTEEEQAKPINTLALE